MSASVKLAEIYESLPPDAQQSLLETHLLPLLDALPPELSNNVLSSAAQARSRFREMPRLDLKGKKKEVNGLMDALNLDAKLAFTRDRSNQEELLCEVVDSLSSWLNDIWSVAYEFHDHFHLAHVCLLFTADVASTLSEVPGLGCRCSLTNMPIDIRIRARDRKIVRSFALRGPHTLDRVILWIWRDLFLSMLAHATCSAKNKIPEMIQDIEMLMGWRALVRLLYGGSPFVSKSEDDDAYDAEPDEELPDHGVFYSVFPDATHTPCLVHAAHWPASMDPHRIRLCELVQDRLHTLFCALPSLAMFNVLRAISPDASARLLQETEANASKSPDTLAGALAIYTAQSDAQRIAALLDTHTHLLRPRDTQVFWSAVRVLVLAKSPCALAILSRELHGAVRAIHAALTTVLGRTGAGDHRPAIEGILALRAGSPARAERIRRWADAVLAPPTPMDPVAFAAMVMGFPLGGDINSDTDTASDTDDGAPLGGGGGGGGAGAAHAAHAAHEADPGGFLDDVDEADGDFDEMREEFRPPLKERLERWHQLVFLATSGGKEKGGAEVFAGVYEEAVDAMPFLRAADIVEQMLERLFEVRGKRYVARALESLSDFCVSERKKMAAAARGRKKRTRNAAAAAVVVPPFLFLQRNENENAESELPAFVLPAVDDVD